MSTVHEAPPLEISWRTTKGVVLLADIDGFFPMAAKMKLDELCSFSQSLYGLWGREIRRQRGEVVMHVGDSVVGLFTRDGCGTADPEWCATLAGFHICKAVKKLRPELDVNVAINVGEVADGRWEEQGRTMRALLGETVNRAALLVNGKQKGIFATRPVAEILGPRVKMEKFTFRLPSGNGPEESIYRLVSLIL
ncbi:MAG TPA: adenylate/guanylate cyclase domain-containing protein [Candidatus Ozemobacteraceae bacterium]